MTVQNLKDMNLGKFRESFYRFSNKKIKIKKAFTKAQNHLYKAKKSIKFMKSA
jgi:hypothetical protein